MHDGKWESRMKLSLSDYFSRMITVPQIGNSGLQRLQSARVAVVGIGGVGSAAAFYLAKAGVGHLKLIDQDIVEPSNLHRLEAIDQSHLYHPKAEAMAESLSRLTPWTEASAIVETLRPTNVEELLEGSDVVVDGLDNFRTRYLLNAYSVKTSTPYLFTSAIQNQGHVGSFYPPRTACMECGLPNVTDRPEDSCENLGVTPTITGLVGSLAASETVNAILSPSMLQQSILMTIDSAIPDFFKVAVLKREECQACGKSSTETSKSGIGMPVVLCGGKTFNVLPEPGLTISLGQSRNSVFVEDVLTSTSTVLVYRKGQATVSLFRSGRVLVDGIETEEEALRIAREAWSLAGENAISVS